MIRRFIIGVFLILFYPAILNGQSFIKLDSIVCYQIPWMTTTVFNIDKNELVRGDLFNNIKTQETSCKSEDALRYFELFLSSDNKSISKNSLIEEFDPRMVLILFFEKGASDTLLIDNRKKFFLTKSVFYQV